VSTAARRRWILAGVLALVAVVLFGGRWAAAETAERAWAAAVPGGQAYVDARTLARLVRAAVLLAATLWGTVQLYLVYRAIGSVQVPRRLGNIEIVEAVPQRLLLAVALGLGLLYGVLLAIGTGDWWLAVALASEPPRFGVSDPVLQRDLGYYLAGLPWTMQLQNRALLASFSAVVLVGLLYVGIGALRFERARPVAGPHARSHLGTLLTTLALVLAWGALLDPAEVVAGAHGPLDHAALTVRLPGSTAVVVAALLVAGLNLAWAWRGRPAALSAAWGFLLMTQLVVYILAPALVRMGRGGGGDAGKTSESALAARRTELERLAFGLTGLREEPLPDFSSPRAAAAVLPLWDAEGVIAVARHGAKFGARGTPAAAALYLPAVGVGGTGGGGVGGRPAWLVTPAPDADAWQDLSPPATWDEIHRGQWARADAPLLAVETDRGLAFAPAPVRDSVVWFGAGFTEFALASPDTWPALRPAGVPLDGWGRRAALAWALQSPEILDGQQGALLLWRRDPRDRLARLLPAARFDAAVPVLADGSLWWVAYGYVESDFFPIVRRPGSAVRPVPSPPVPPLPRYLRLGFVGTVRAGNGETRVYLAPGHDSLSAAWGRIFAPLVRPAAELPASLAAALHFPRRSFDAAAAEIARQRPDTAAWHVRPDQPLVVPAPGRAGLDLWMAQGFETARPPAFVALLAGRMTAHGPTLVLWRPAVPPPRPGTLAGSSEMRPGALRIWPAGGALFAMQGQFSASVARPQSGADRALARVYVWWGERIGQGPTADAALRDLLVQGAAADTTLAGRWDRARRLAAQADSALERGDLQEFARLYEQLKDVLDVGRAKLAPTPRPR
jgi:uncharacterized protein UPF0182